MILSLDVRALAPFMDTLVGLPESLSFEAGAAISCGTGTAYGALKRLVATTSGPFQAMPESVSSYRSMRPSDLN